MDVRPPLTVTEVARRRGVSEDTVLGWIHSGELVATDEGAGKKRATWRIEESDLAVFLSSRRNVKLPAAGPSPRTASLPEVERLF